MSHNTLRFSAPKILHNHCFHYLLGLTIVPREIQKTMLVQNFWGENFMGHVEVVNCDF